MIGRKTTLRFVAAACAVSLLAGCASEPEVTDAEEARALEAESLQRNDPLEPMNRVIFDMNQSLDIFILRPIAFTYKEVVPEYGQARVTDFLNNLRSPVVFVNDILQGDADAAAITLARFLFNSTFGLLGLADVATEAGLPYHDNGFGATFDRWGMDEGPYLVLPLIGPSSMRDGVGMGLDVAVDPITWITFFDTNGYAWVSWSRLGLRIVDTRARYYDVIEEVQKDSIDFYATMRTLYRQRRAAELSGQIPGVKSPEGPGQLKEVQE